MAHAGMLHPDRPLRLLMVIHTLWTRNLGGPRAQLELAEEMRALGASVEKLSLEDAFPHGLAPRLPGRLGTVERMLAGNRSFAARAAAWVRANAGRFDVIDANQTDLPYDKRRLGFSGLLVARSVGLIPAYAEFERWAARRWPEPPSLRRVAQAVLTAPGARRRRRDAVASFRTADLVNVSNRDDLEAVAGMGFGDKAVTFPFGLSAARRQAFLTARAGAAERLAACTVAFIGTWNSRKGARDWPAIVARVRVRVAAARFLFLGTGIPAERVLADLAPADRAAATVVPAYEADELPALLASATVGAFPGYLEGFGFGVLEMLAAGLPTVTYDAPGPRDMMRRLAEPAMVPAGDVEAFAAAVAERLVALPERSAALGVDAARVAGLFCWRQIARDTLDVYRERWERLRG